jgi:hypothetical protein
MRDIALFSLALFVSTALAEFCALRRWYGRRGAAGVAAPTHVLAMCAILFLAIVQSGCVIACGPSRCPPPQKLRLVASSPGSYTIRIVDVTDEHFDTGVQADRRVQFDVPVYSRHCTQYLFGVIKIHSPTPVEARRVIRVMKDSKIVCKLSATDIAKLPVDSDGYHVLRIEK